MLNTSRDKINTYTNIEISVQSICLHKIKPCYCPYKSSSNLLAQIKSTISHR